MPAKQDLKGMIFGRLTALDNNSPKVTCRCECGKVKGIARDDFKSGHTKSCGCFRRETTARGSISRATHGMSQTKVHQAWRAIKDRCYNLNNSRYDTYGGRGILMRDCWVHSFEQFYAYIGDPPRGRVTRWSIERLDNNGNYDKGNIVWSSPFDQARNKGKMRSNKSGVTGVSLKISRGKESSWVASWVDLEKNSTSKGFSIIKYGNDLAFKLACEHRTKMIESLNQQGAGYSDSHGQDYK